MTHYLTYQYLTYQSVWELNETGSDQSLHTLPLANSGRLWITGTGAFPSFVSATATLAALSLGGPSSVENASSLAGRASFTAQHSSEYPYDRLVVDISSVGRSERD